MLLRHLLDRIDVCAPLGCAEPWDNVGLLLGRDDAPVRRALLTIDLTDAVLQEAQALSADLIIAYHPPWFGAKKRLVGDDIILAAARANLNIFSPHTALDAAHGGTNDVLADAAGVPAQRRQALAPLALEHPHALGMGRVGSLSTPQPLGPWLAALKEAMGVQHALISGPNPAQGGPEAQVARVAVCAGAGDDLWQRALAAGADTFVVGELRHHHALGAAAQKMRVVALLHSASERAALAPYARKLQNLAPDVTFHVSRTDMDPYAFT